MVLIYLQAYTAELALIHTDDLIDLLSLGVRMIYFFLEKLSEFLQEYPCLSVRDNNVWIQQLAPHVHLDDRGMIPFVRHPFLI